MLTDHVANCSYDLDGIPCLLPDGAVDWHASNGLPSPVPGNAISFILPRGKHYGRGHAILLGSRLPALTNKNEFSHTLTFRDTYTGEFKIRKLGIVRIQAVTGLIARTDDTAYLVELADQRWLGRYSTINAAYNARSFRVSDPGGSPVYYEATINGSVPWTWKEIVQKLWSFLPSVFGVLTDSGKYPAFPPENLHWRGVSAWDALCSFLDLSGNVAIRKLDGTFEIVSMSDTQTSGMETPAIRNRLWVPTNDFMPVAFLPETVKVYFPTDYYAFQAYGDREVVAGQDAYRLKPLYDLSVSTAAVLSASDQIQNSIIPGTVLPLHVPQTARYRDDGFLINHGSLNTFATQLATRYLKAMEWKTTGTITDFHSIYHGFERSLLPGNQTEAVAWYLCAQGSKTEVLLSPLEYRPADRKGYLGETAVSEYLAYEPLDPPDLARTHEPTERWGVFELLSDVECDGEGADADLLYGSTFNAFMGVGSSGVQHKVYNPSKTVAYKAGDLVYCFWHWQAKAFIIIGPAPTMIFKGRLQSDLCSGDAELDDEPTSMSCCAYQYPTRTAANPLQLQGQAGDIVYLIYDCELEGLAILNIQHHVVDTVEGFGSENGCVPELDEYGNPTGNLIASGDCRITYRYRPIAITTCQKIPVTGTVYTFTRVDVMINWYTYDAGIYGEFQPVYVACPCDPYTELLHRGTRCGYGSQPTNPVPPGPGGSGTCCDPMPTELTGTITSKTGAAVAFPNTITFTGTPWSWTSNTLPNPCGPDPSTSFTLVCVSTETPAWELKGVIGATLYTFTFVSADCDGKRLVFSLNFNNGAGCSGSFRIAITW